MQCIPTDATIDCGILFTNYCPESRRGESIGTALSGAYPKAVRTILAPGLIIICVIGSGTLIGVFFVQAGFSAIFLSAKAKQAE